MSDPYGLEKNVCRPSVLTADVEYALQTNDPWYGGLAKDVYNKDPGALTNGVSQPKYKRDRTGDEDGMVVFDFSEDGEGGATRMTADDSNSTRLATDEELQEQLGYVRCQMPDCSKELDEWRLMQADAAMATATTESATDLVLVAATATATATATSAGASTTGMEATRPTLVAYAPGHPANEHRKRSFAFAD